MQKRPSIADCALAHRKALGLTVENQAQQLELAQHDPQLDTEAACLVAHRWRAIAPGCAGPAG